MAGTPTLPTSREESGTHVKTPEKAAFMQGKEGFRAFCVAMVCIGKRSEKNLAHNNAP